MLIPLHIDKEVIHLSQALKHSTTLMANKVRTDILSTCSLATRINHFEVVTPATVAIIMPKRQIVGSQDPGPRLQITKGLLRPEVEVDTSKTFSGLRAAATTTEAVVKVIKHPLRTNCEALHQRNQSLLRKRLMMTILSVPLRTCESKIRRRKMRRCRPQFGKARIRPQKRAPNSASRLTRSLQPQPRQNRHQT